MAWESVRAARAVHEASLFARANVVGVAVGQKVIRGHRTDEPCVVVFVQRKRPAKELRRRDLVPLSLDGIRRDVVETGRFFALEAATELSVARTGRFRPAPGGVSIAHSRVSAGTLGAVGSRDGRILILSNNHILANSNDALFGDPILQPGPADRGGPHDAIGHLEDYVPIVFDERPLGPFGRSIEQLLGPALRWFGLGIRRLPRDGTNVVDAAVASPTSSDLVDPDILEIGRVTGSVAAEVGMGVRKSGRTTGLTSGRVTALDAVVEVDYGTRTAVFRGQIVSDLLSRGGDSGSLVVAEGNRAVGLLFAGSATTTLINPIGDVLRALRLSLE